MRELELEAENNTQCSGGRRICGVAAKKKQVAGVWMMMALVERVASVGNGEINNG